MNMTVEEMLQLLGAKEAELYVLRKQIASLQAQLAPKEEAK